jgi:hypothetical protein
VELAVLDPDSLATAQLGAPIRFAVAYAVVVNGSVAIPEGALVTGIVTGSTRGSYSLSGNGRLTIRAQDLRTGVPIRIHIRLRRRANTAVYNPMRGPSLGTIGTTVVVIVGALAVLALLGGDR